MNRRRVQGFTLIELIIFIVVIGVGLAGILAVSNSVVRSSADPLVSKQTLAIAESLLEEILLKDYVKPAGSAAPGFAAGGARNLYDTVDDYAGYVTAGGVVDVSGAALPGLGAYNVAPAVTVNVVVLGGTTLKRIVVSVTGPQGTIALTGFRGNY